METEKVVKRGLLVGLILAFLAALMVFMDERASKNVSKWRNDTNKEFQQDFPPKR